MLVQYLKVKDLIKKVFKEQEHTNRLIHSAKTLGFDLPYSSSEIFEIRKKVLEANNISDGYIRPVAWRGSEMMGISAQKIRYILQLLHGNGPLIFLQRLN